MLFVFTLLHSEKRALLPVRHKAGVSLITTICRTQFIKVCVELKMVKSSTWWAVEGQRVHRRAKRSLVESTTCSSVICLIKVTFSVTLNHSPSNCKGSSTLLMKSEIETVLHRAAYKCVYPLCSYASFLFLCTLDAGGSAWRWRRKEVRKPLEKNSCCERETQKAKGTVRIFLNNLGEFTVRYFSQEATAGLQVCTYESHFGSHYTVPLSRLGEEWQLRHKMSVSVRERERECVCTRARLRSWGVL